MFDLIIFDCDGVLADTEPLAAGVLADMVRELGPASLPHDVHASMFTGARLSIVLEAIETHLGRPLPGTFLADFRARSAERFRADLRPMPGVLDALRALDRRACVASNGPRAKVELIVEVCGLSELLPAGIHSAYEANIWKPEPMFFHWVASRCNAAPERCLVVDDSAVGIEAARGAGMPAILFDPERTLWDSWKRANLATDGAWPLHHMRDLAALVRSIE